MSVSPPATSPSPSHYSTDSEDHDPVDVSFTFHGHTIHATRIEAQHSHSHVKHLKIHRSGAQAYIHRLTRLLPLAILHVLVIFAPLCVLPTAIVLKARKPGWDDEFENEKNMYMRRLRTLQGQTIPICYGAAVTAKDVPALLLEDVGGVPLHKEPAMLLTPKRIRFMLDEAYRTFTQLRTGYDDIKPDNFRLVGDKIIILDLESAWEMAEGVDPEMYLGFGVGYFMRLWNQAKEAHDYLHPSGMVIVEDAPCMRAQVESLPQKCPANAARAPNRRIRSEHDDFAPLQRQP